MIDATYYGYGVALPLVGYTCGVILKIIVKTLNMGGNEL